MSKKKILLSLTLIATVAVAVSGVTVANWSASATIAGNTVSAATVSLALVPGQNTSTVQKPITGADNLLPGDWSDWHHIGVENTGTVAGTVHMYVENVQGSGGICANTNLEVESHTDSPGSTEQNPIYNGPLMALNGPANAIELTGVGSFDPTLPAGWVLAVLQRAGLDSNTPNSAQGQTCTWDEVFVLESYSPAIPFTTDLESDQGHVNSLGNSGGDTAFSVGSTFILSDWYGGNTFTLNITEDGDDLVFTVTTPFVVAGGDNSMALLFDANNSGTADFQHEYKGNPGDWFFQDVVTNSWNSASAPGDHDLDYDGAMEFSVTVPKSDLEDTFKIGVHATNNGSPVDGTHVGMAIPTTTDLFNVAGDSSWTSSANYLEISL